MASKNTIRTPLTALLGIKHPIFLAGMNVAAGPELAAAVTNAGGIGVIGGVGYSPKFLQQQIDDLKAGLDDKGAPFGVDLLLPKVGDGARATNKDYTGGKLGELIDIICGSGAKLFVCAVGVPPRWAVDKLHAANILVMNMVGAPKHVPKALGAGVDLICAQGGEGGGHTGDVPTSILIPACVDLCRGRTSPMSGEPVAVVAAGGIYDGRGLAMALALGAQGVWVGTRFVASKEAGAPPRHQQAVLECGYHDTVRTVIYTGRPMRVRRNAYNADWEDNRAGEIKTLTAAGKLPIMDDLSKQVEEGKEFSTKERMELMPLLMGKVAGAITEVLPAAVIMADMVDGAADVLRGAAGAITSKL